MRTFDVRGVLRHLVGVVENLDRQRVRIVAHAVLARNRRREIPAVSDKPMFSFLRELTTWHCPHSAAARRCGAVAADRRPCSNRYDVCWSPGPQQQTRSSDVRRPVGQTDRQTDVRPTVAWTLLPVSGYVNRQTTRCSVVWQCKLVSG